MTHTPNLIVISVLVGAGGVVASVLIHGFAVTGIVIFGRRRLRVGRAGTGFWNDLTIVTIATIFAFTAHLLEISFWAVLFWVSGEFSGVVANLHYAAANYTTLGSAEAPTRSALLAPLAAADGMLMFGVSTAMLFAVIQRLLGTRFPDLRD